MMSSQSLSSNLCQNGYGQTYEKLISDRYHLFSFQRGVSAGGWMGPAPSLLKVVEPRGPVGGPAGDVREEIHGKGFCWESWRTEALVTPALQILVPQGQGP